MRFFTNIRNAIRTELHAAGLIRPQPLPQTTHLLFPALTATLTQGEPTIAMSNIATDATETEFDAAYLAAQPAAVQSMMRLPYGSGTAKTAQASTLAHEGYLIDVTIMLWGWSAYRTNKMRLAYGYTWTPSALMPPIQIAPGLVQGKTPPYDASTVPPGGILVTLDMDLLPSLFSPLAGTPAAATVLAAEEAKKKA